MTDSPAVRTVLFDIDGTLVDSNYLHIDAWSRAFASIERPIAAWRIHRRIGMDGSLLLDDLLGADAAELGERAKAVHDRLYADMADRLRPFAGARELLTTLDRRGIRVVLATSAPQQELDRLLPVLDVPHAIDVVTSSEDTETAKPAPDVVQTALERAETDPRDALFVGDAVWDMSAAGRAGVRSIAVRTGGYGEDELRSAGAVAVYDDVAAIAADLERLLAGTAR
ncbi:HAD family hydrolase [Microbacterium sp. NPDC091313]